MAISLDQAQTQADIQNNEGARVSDEDVEIAFRMAVQMMTEGGGLDVIRSAINESQDPAQVIGQILAQLMGQLAEQLQNEIGLDPRVFLAQGGWLDLMLDYIETKLGYPEEFSDQIYAQVLDIVKAAAIGGQQAPNDVMQPGQGPQQPQPQAAPPQPGMGLGG